MLPQYAPVGANNVPNVPYPSLVSVLLPQLHDMEEFLSTMLESTERIPVWSTNTANHEPLLHSIAEVKGKVMEWKRSMTSSLQSKWMSAAAEYSAYKQQVDTVLRKRHSAEILFLFPSLKTAEKESQLDPTSAMMMSDEERSVRSHLASLGYGYDKSAEGAARRVTKLVKRQEKERNVFETTVHHHSDQLMAAKKADMARMQQELERTEQLLQSVVSVVEGKIAAASRMQTSTLYHRNSPRTTQRTSPPRPRAPVLPPTSAGLSRHGTNSARSDRSSATQLHTIAPAVSTTRVGSAQPAVAPQTGGDK